MALVGNLSVGSARSSMSSLGGLAGTIQTELISWKVGKGLG